MKRLSLRTERLTALNEEELRFAAGGAEESITYTPECILTLRHCWSGGTCTLLCSDICFQTEK